MKTFQESSSNINDYDFYTNAFLPNVATVPLSQETNCSCKCLVSKGDFVKEGDVIARPASENGYKAVIHSPIPGKVIDIVSTLCPNGTLDYSVKIQLQGSFSYTGKPFGINDWKSYSASTIVTKITEYGVINTFFSNESLSLGEQIKKQSKRQTKSLVIRLFDEDFTRITDSLFTKHFLSEILEATKIVSKAMSADNIVFVVAPNFKKICPIFFEQIKDEIILEVNAKKYTSGFKREITKTFNKVFKKQIDTVLSEDDLFIDSSTLYEVYRTIVQGIPSTSRFIHFSGNCIQPSCFIDVKIGTTINEVIKQLGGFKENPSLIIINGRICGFSVNSLDIPITKYVKSIEFISRLKRTDYQIHSCVYCGNCRYVCPEKLSPDIIYNYMSNNKVITEQFINSSLFCTNCGLCNSVCPSRLPLSQTICVLKQKLERK